MGQKCRYLAKNAIFGQIWPFLGQTSISLRDIKLKKEKDPLKVSDAYIQTPKTRRSGGKASRMRRLLAFQQMLTKKKGLPKSRLLTLKEADARQSKREESLWMQEESASPLLRRRQASMVKADKEEVDADLLDLEK